VASDGKTRTEFDENRSLDFFLIGAIALCFSTD